MNKTQESAEIINMTDTEDENQHVQEQDDSYDDNNNINNNHLEESDDDEDEETDAKQQAQIDHRRFGRKPKQNPNKRRKKRGGGTPDINVNTMGNNGSGAESPWMQNIFTQIYQDLRSLSKDFNVPISVPELLFFGFQSSGKTSTLSILAQTPAGTMRDGTGTRCPVRYRLTYNENCKDPVLYVNNHRVRNYEEQTESIMKHMQSLAENPDPKQRFTSKILEAAIESKDVPNIIFVDMPGLIKKDDATYGEWKLELENITSDLGTRRSADGESFQFIPIFVREAYDIENDAGEFETVNRLFRDKRPNWVDDTLFIINKFDTKGNRKDAASFIKYMYELQGNRETVITIANPDGQKTARMKPNELAQHIKTVPRREQEWWRDAIAYFQDRGDHNAQKLKQVQQELCGVDLMNEILVKKMCNIVKNTLPLLQSQLERAERQKQAYIAKLQQELDLEDPEKLKQKVLEFNHTFLTALADFYKGRDLANVRKLRQSWLDDMNDFHSMKQFSVINKSAQQWDRQGFYIDCPKLEQLLTDCDRTDLVQMIRARLVGAIAIRRALDLWIAMISFMSFPPYTHEDILNFMNPFNGTIQADPWFVARNVVYHSAIHLKNGCIWFGEYLRYRLKKNADIIFSDCLADELNTSNTNTTPTYNQGYGGHGAGMHVYNGRMGSPGLDDYDTGLKSLGKYNKKFKRNNRIEKKSGSDQDMERLLRIGLTDYKKLVDTIVNEFQSAVEIVPADQGEILDRKFHEDILNLANLLKNLLYNSKDNEMILVEPKSEKDRKEDRKNREIQQRIYQSQSETIQSKQEDEKEKENIRLQNEDENGLIDISDNDININNNNDEIDEIDELDNIDEIAFKDKEKEKDKSNKKKKKKRYDKHHQQQQQNDFLDDGLNEGFNENQVAGQKMRRREAHIELPKHLSKDDKEKYDCTFYVTMFPSESKNLIKNMSDKDTSLIRTLARVIWVTIKKHVLSTTQQTLTNRVLSEIKETSKRFNDALQIGVDWPNIQYLVKQLENKTKIQRGKMLKMIHDESQIPQSKGVAHMTNDEIKIVYGVRLEEKQKEYEERINDLKQFLKKKEDVQAKIQELQNVDM